MTQFEERKGEYGYPWPLRINPDTLREALMATDLVDGREGGDRDQLVRSVRVRLWINGQLELHDKFPNPFRPGTPEDVRYLASSLSAHAGRLMHMITKGWDGVPRVRDPEERDSARRETSRARMAREVADIRMFLELLSYALNIDPDAAASIRLDELRANWRNAPPGGAEGWDVTQGGQLPVSDAITRAILASEEAQRVP